MSIKNLLHSLPESLITEIFEYANNQINMYQKNYGRNTGINGWMLIKYERHKYEKSERLLFIFTGFATPDCFFIFFTSKNVS